MPWPAVSEPLDGLTLRPAGAVIVKPAGPPDAASVKAAGKGSPPFADGASVIWVGDGTSLPGGGRVGVGGGVGGRVGGGGGVRAGVGCGGARGRGGGAAGGAVTMSRRGWSARQRATGRSPVRPAALTSRTGTSSRRRA